MPAAPDRALLPTGILPGATSDLSTVEKAALAEWMAGKAGDDDGRPWWPAAIRRLTVADRLRQAFDPGLDAAWCERERRRVARDVGYFTWHYGHVQPGGARPIPFLPWPATEAPGAVGAASQAEVLHILEHELRVLLLKARQIGMTWLVLHYAFHRQAFHPATPNAKILSLSKHGEDATKALAKARRIRALLPSYLRPEEDPETRGSLSRFKLAGRGTMVSLTGNPAAARQETADIAILDEYGFIKNGKAAETSTAVEPTVGDHGQIFKLSTGNGRTGDGAALAADWSKARRGESDYVAIFLPASTDPARTPEWRAKRIGRYPSEEKFLQEHPETEDQALGGEGQIRVYPAAHLAAAVQIGAAIAEHEGGRFYEELVAGEGLEIVTDWGDLQTFTTYQAALPGLGFYAIDELVQGHVEPAEASDAILDYRPGGIPSPRFVASQADSAPAGTNRTFTKALLEHHRAAPARFPDQHVKVPFGTYKEGGGDRRHGVTTIGFIRNRLAAAAAFVAQPDWRQRIHEASGVAAIHPRCKTLLGQMERLERDPKTGKVKKPNTDPQDPMSGDHGPDSLVAGNFKRAEMWTATLPADDGTDDDDG